MDTTITTTTGEAIAVRNIYCIGRNYVDHIKELGNVQRDTPAVFLKPTSALCHEGEAIHLPAFSKNVHYEGELVLLIGKGGKAIAEADALAHISHVGLGLDLTARDVQDEAKKNGLPWTIGKGFDQSACVSKFVPVAQVADINTLQFTLSINGEERQRGDGGLMIFSPAQMIAFLSGIFTLQAGDLIYTGTPKGVGALHAGDVLEMTMGEALQARFVVAE